MYRVYAAQGHIQIHVDNGQNGGIQDGRYFQDGDQLNKNNDILMNIITMLSAAIDTLYLTVIHFRINLFK